MLRTLNRMFVSRDAADWWGLGILVLSLLAVAAGWFLTKPLFMTAVVGRMGGLGKRREAPRTNYRRVVSPADFERLHGPQRI